MPKSLPKEAKKVILVLFPFQLENAESLDTSQTTSNC